MEQVTNWLKLWEQLAQQQNKTFERRKKNKEGDMWKEKAHYFDRKVEKKWEKLDSSREFVLSTLKKNPGSTLLDIGAGTGSWSVYLSPYAKTITALEPSPSMSDILHKKISRNTIKNINFIQGSWPETTVEKHDFILVSHSIYGIPDFKTCIDKMIDTARKSCFILLRIPYTETVMAKAAQRIWGQPYDSTNFQIAYNCLMQMNIYPNVIREVNSTWEPWRHKTLQEAFDSIKDKFGLHATDEYDEYLLSLLQSNLKKDKDSSYVWPEGNGSALLYWDIG